MTTDPVLAAVFAASKDALARLALLFKPGMRLTLVARHPGHADRHVIVTDDDLAALAELLAAEAAKEGEVPK